MKAISLIVFGFLIGIFFSAAFIANAQLPKTKEEVIGKTAIHVISVDKNFQNAVIEPIIAPKFKMSYEKGVHTQISPGPLQCSVVKRTITYDEQRIHVVSTALRCEDGDWMVGEVIFSLEAK